MLRVRMTFVQWPCASSQVARMRVTSSDDCDETRNYPPQHDLSRAMSVNVT